MSLKSLDILIPTEPPTKYPSPALSLMPPSNHPGPAPLTMPPKVDSVSPSDIARMHLQDIPDIHPCNTASLSDIRLAFDPFKIHCIFGCRHFFNPKHITPAAENSTLIYTCKPPTAIGAFAAITK